MPRLEAVKLRDKWLHLCWMHGAIGEEPLTRPHFQPFREALCAFEETSPGSYVEESAPAILRSLDLSDNTGLILIAETFQGLQFPSQKLCL